ncbi:MAG: ATP-binding protein [bacterium]|nr:ATP-binding protein [bacterium]
MDQPRYIERLREELSASSLQFEERIRESAAIRRIGAALQHTRDAHRVFEVIIDLMLAEAGAENCSIFLYDSEKNLAYLKAAKGQQDQDMGFYNMASLSPRSFRTGEGVVGWVVQHQKAAFFSDVRHANQFVPDPASSVTVGALFCLPLMAEGEISGVLNLSHSSPEAFQVEDRRFLESIAEHIAVTLNSIQVFDELQQFNTLLETEVSRATEALREANESLREREQDLERLNQTLETRVRQRTFELQNLVENLPAGVCLLDEEKRLIVANPVAQEYLELLAQVGLDGEVVRIGTGAVEGLVFQSGGVPKDVLLEGPPRRIFEVLAQPIVEEGTGRGWVLVVREVTHEREVQEHVLQQDRLAAVGQLAAGIAHDFNNLLTVILASAEILGLEETFSESGRSYLDMISGQGQRAALLVRQILDFSRKSIVRREPVVLRQFVTDMVGLLERTLPETIRITASFEIQDDEVHADPTQLQQVLTNLAVNARDAMPGGGTFHMALSRLELVPGQPLPMPELVSGDWVVLEISDTGTGMPPEILEHVFDPFFTTKGPDKGTGLGLAQVYGIVKQHAGEILVTSEEGQGTTFKIYLPSAPKISAPVEEIRTPIPKGSGETILVVEDEEAVRELVQTLLERLDYQVLSASNGDEALSVYDAHKDEISLVLTDVVMPKMGGRELLAALHTRNAGIPVVVMTGYPLGESGDTDLVQDTAGYLEKPIRLEPLSRLVREVLDQAS